MARAGFLLKLSDVSPPEGEPLPTEFRIFKPGVNDSTKGPLRFCKRSARNIMRDAAARNVDLMIDLEHCSVDPDALTFSPKDASDAMGWFRLAMRGGELWAVNVRWTDEGAERLRSKKQRYISPVVTIRKRDGVMMRLLNVALVSMPATHSAAPLVAASMRKNGASFSMDAKKILDTINGGDGNAAIELLKEIAAELMGAGASGGTEDPDSPEGDTEDPALGETPPDEVKRAIRSAVREATKDLRASLTAISGTTKEATEQVRTLAAAKAEAEAKRRVELVSELVRLGMEIPGTAWKDADAMIPADHLAAEPISSLDARVEAYRMAHGGPSPELRPGTRPSGSAEVKLSAADQAVADRITDPRKRADFTAMRIRSLARQAQA